MFHIGTDLVGFFYLLFIYTAFTGMVEGKLWMYFSGESVKLAQKNLPLQTRIWKEVISVEK